MRVALVTNIPAPYRMPVFRALAATPGWVLRIFVSAERLMYCAMGVCCHCMIRGTFTCVDGPVFRYDEIKELTND